jgi:CRP/FNR family transcriptional regulator, cyclic AMP receptor protein
MGANEMLHKFKGDKGRGPLVEAIAKQPIVAGNHVLAEEIAGLVVLRAVPAGATLIEQADEDNDLFLIFEGEFQILVDGVVVAKRGAGDYVGEIAAIQPEFKRTATVVAKSDAVVGQLTEAALADLGDRYPTVYRAMAQQLAAHLLQRNKPGGV